jgi:DNA processing protein
MNTKYWLALNRIPKLGPSTVKKLYDSFGSVEVIWRAAREDFSKVDGISRPQVESILRARHEIDLDNVLESAQGHDYLTLDDPSYPAHLKNIYDPPPVIYYKGDAKALSKKAIAIVGTRTPSSYGLAVTERLSEELSQLGFVIVSGMAYGIDTAAHKGALEAGGKTIAVFGCGIDKIYPAENVRLSESISGSGCLLSEFTPGTPTSNWTFPQRNRIISGLSMGVVVVEGGVDSGSLITAKSALDQGREVFAVPGQVENQNAKGPHWLIKQGAKLIDGVEDILDELNMPLPANFRGQKPEQRDLSGLSDQERAICEILINEQLHIDDVAAKSSLSPQEVSSVLMMLEVKGFIKQLPGKIFGVS